MHVRSDGGLVENLLLQESIEWNFFLSGQFREKCRNSPQYRFLGSPYLPGILCQRFHREKTSKNHSEHNFFSCTLVLKLIRIHSQKPVTSNLSQFWPLYDTLNSPVITKS